MMYKMTELKYEPDPRLERALDILFILHADHEQNCSTSAVRSRRLVAGRPVLGGRRRRRRALRPAARRRQRGGAADAAPDRDEGQHPRLHRGREGRRRAPDGLRPPRLQELRPAREDHQEGLRGRLRGHRAATRCSTSRSSSRRSRSRTTTSSRASSTRTSTSTRASSTRRSGLPVEMFPVMFAIGAHERLDRPVAGDGRRQGAEDRPPAPDLHGRARRATTCRSTSARRAPAATHGRVAL